MAKNIKLINDLYSLIILKKTTIDYEQTNQLCRQFLFEVTK